MTSFIPTRRGRTFASWASLLHPSRWCMSTAPCSSTVPTPSPINQSYTPSTRSECTRPGYSNSGKSRSLDPSASSTTSRTNRTTWAPTAPPLFYLLKHDNSATPSASTPNGEANNPYGKSTTKGSRPTSPPHCTTSSELTRFTRPHQQPRSSELVHQWKPSSSR